MIDRLNRIIEGWYIFEPALFEISLSHELRENPSMTCGMRCGEGVIEYNRQILDPLSDDLLEMTLMRECVRIILRHPYERQPADCDPLPRYLASQIVIGDNYAMRPIDVPLSSDFGLPRGRSFEWYAHKLNDVADRMQSGIAQVSLKTSVSVEQAAEASALWKEDTFQLSMIDNLVERIEAGASWGSLPGELVARIKADAQAKIDYRNVLSGFRASILSSKRNLTRMRPNRRTGFANMGSVRKMRTRLLVAVDVSGSISDESLRAFFSVVNKAFRYGVEKLDLVTFDVGIHDKMEWAKARNQVNITGRGGTDFQLVIDHAQEQRYDGLLIFTDGEAPVPVLPPHPCFRLAWVFDSEESFRRNSDPFSKLGRCFTVLL